MTRSRGLKSFVLCSLPLLLGVSPAARADEDPGALRLPVPEAQRPVTLPKLVLAPEAGFDVDRQGNAGVFGNLTLSARFGITDDLTLDAVVAPLQLWVPRGGGFGYGETTEDRGPSLGLTYRFVRGPVEVAASLAGRLFTVSGLSGSAIMGSLPIRIHATESLRLDATPTVNVWIAQQTPSTPPTTIGITPVGAPPSTATSASAVRLQLPLDAIYNVTRAFDLGVTTGLTVYDASDARNTTGIPLGALMGFAMAGSQGPVLDVDPYFSLPYLLMPGRTQPTNSGQYVIGVDLTGYLYL